MIGALYLAIGMTLAWHWRTQFNDREFWAVASIIVLLWFPILLALVIAYLAAFAREKVKQWR